MKKLVTDKPQEALEAIDALFEEFPPVLVEARFPGTSPDWYLFQGREQFDDLLTRLGSVAELHISSVFDLTNTKKEIVVSRGDLDK